jgi:hypothetical protein
MSWGNLASIEPSTQKVENNLLLISKSEKLSSGDYLNFESNQKQDFNSEQMIKSISF